MNTQEHLWREIGFWVALTIGTGIFLLSRIAISLVRPAVIFSYIFAGIVCIITVASAAELATSMPTIDGEITT